MSPAYLETLSDDEFDKFILDLSLRIAENKARLESQASRGRRTRRLIRGTFLAVGGLVGATFDGLAGIITIVGLWDWVDAFAEDARLMNEQLALARDLAVFEQELALAAAELRRRGADRR